MPDRPSLDALRNANPFRKVSEVLDQSGGNNLASVTNEPAPAADPAAVAPMEPSYLQRAMALFGLGGPSAPEVTPRDIALPTEGPVDQKLVDAAVEYARTRPSTVDELTRRALANSGR